MGRYAKLIGFVLGGLVALLIAAVATWVIYMRNIEQPDYDVVRKDGDIEIREYGSMVVAEVTRSGNRSSAVRSGFRPLARYIFAEERQGEKISMTAPVTQQPTDDGNNNWNVRFIMPSGYDLDLLPLPENSDVRLVQLNPVLRAAVRFSGRADDQLITRQETRLRKWLEQNELNPAGSPMYAYYNDPFTPGFLRRNEVLFDLSEDP